MSITWFRAKHELGATILTMRTFYRAYFNKYDTILVADFDRDLLVVEGDAEAVRAYGMLLYDHVAYETIRSGPYGEIYVSHNGLSRVRVITWWHWHFDEEGRFCF